MSEKLPDLLEEQDTRAEDETREPPMYKVLLHNDDFTTRDFVVEVLVAIFAKSVEEVTRLMWHIHRNGTGVCGVYPFEIAETKVSATTLLAHEKGFPLKTTLEQM